MEVKDILLEAFQVTKDADLPEELQATAFGKAVDLVAGAAGFGKAQIPAQPPAPTGSAGGDLHVTGDGVGAIAAQLGTDREGTERVFHVDADELQLVAASNKLAGPKKAATREITLLLVAGRQACGLDQEWTDADVVRPVADHYRKYDPPNFSRTIKEMDDVLIIREAGRKKMLKMTQPGWEAARVLVDRIVGGA